MPSSDQSGQPNVPAIQSESAAPGAHPAPVPDAAPAASQSVERPPTTKKTVDNIPVNIPDNQPEIFPAEALETPPAIPAVPAPQTDIYKLYPVDGTGIYSLPPGFTAQNIDGVYCNGECVEYVPVKGGTEIDVPLARRGSNVPAILTK
jgi:hypothetical protein